MKAKATMKFSLKTKGLDNLRRRIKSASSHVSKVGFWNGTSNDGEMSIASLAFLQEYGRPQTAVHNFIPARPFFRMSAMNVANGRSDVRHYMKVALQQIISGKQTTQNSLQMVGEVYEDELKAIITYFDEPPNAARTVSMKGKDDPLVDSGHMRDSVQNKVTKRGVDV